MKRALAGGWLLAALSGCTDPGCIRNSECGTGELCIASVCVREREDAGMSVRTSEPSARDGADAGRPERGAADAGPPNAGGSDAAE